MRKFAGAEIKHSLCDVCLVLNYCQNSINSLVSTTYNSSLQMWAGGGVPDRGDPAAPSWPAGTGCWGPAGCSSWRRGWSAARRGRRSCRRASGPAESSWREYSSGRISGWRPVLAGQAHCWTEEREIFGLRRVGQRIYPGCCCLDLESSAAEIRLFGFRHQVSCSQ